jgi:hypothetical protein
MEYTQDELAKILLESVKRLSYAQERDPDQAGIYYYQEAIDAVRALWGPEAVEAFECEHGEKARGNPFERALSKLSREDLADTLRLLHDAGGGDAQTIEIITLYQHFGPDDRQRVREFVDNLSD